MAHSTLSVLAHPRFPQQFEAAFQQFVTRIRREVLGSCCHEIRVSHGSTGEFDESFPCRNLATVHHLDSDQEYCAKHFLEGSRG